jgi:hypothetical protein
MSTETHSFERFSPRFAHPERLRRLTSFAAVSALSLALWAVIIAILTVI